MTKTVKRIFGFVYMAAWFVFIPFLYKTIKSFVELKSQGLIDSFWSNSFADKALTSAGIDSLVYFQNMQGAIIWVLFGLVISGLLLLISLVKLPGRILKLIKLLLGVSVIGAIYYGVTVFF